VLVIAGYQCSKVARKSVFNAWVRTCSSRCAPRFVKQQQMRWTKRLLITWFTVDCTVSRPQGSPDLLLI